MGRISKGFRQALGLTLTVWLGFVYGGYVVSELIAGRTAFLRDLPFDLPAVLVVALLAQLLYPAARYTAGWPAARRWPVLVLAVIAVAFAQSIVNLLENRVLGVVPALSAEYLPLIRQRFGPNLLHHVYICFGNLGLLVFIVEARASARQRVRMARIAAAEADARATTLRLQLNPHFLFNTINSISSLVVTRRADEAEEMLERLADFLRLSLDGDPAALVRLDEEFDTADAYLAIEAIRFGDRMVIDMACPADLAHVPVPGFILQPLVENAVKYAVSRAMRPVTVRVTARAEDGVLHLLVADDHDGRDVSDQPRRGFGIGLSNIRERLAARYGEAGTLVTERGAGGFRALIRLPLTPGATAS